MSQLIRSRLGSASLFLLLAVTTFLASFPASASAGTYKVVEICEHSRPTLRFEDDPVFPDEPQPNQFIRAEDKCGPDGNGLISLLAEGIFSRGGKRWVIEAPPNTTIRELEYERFFRTLPWDNSFQWQLEQVRAVPLPGGQTILGLESFRAPGSNPELPLPPIEVKHESLNAVAIRGVLQCLERGRTCAGNRGVDAANFGFTLEDNAAPVFTGALGGSLLAEDGVRDTGRLSIGATDKGGGIARVILIVDGVSQTFTEPNDGKCIEPYVDMVPCKLAINDSIPIDTTKLTEGPHEVQVALIDVAGNRVESDPLLFTVRNAPTNTEQPKLLGNLAVGQELAVGIGLWEGEPSAFIYRWMRCPRIAELISECTRIEGEARDEYRVRKADANSRLVVSVTATNRYGSDVAFTKVSDPVARPGGPLLLARLSSKAFRRGARGTVLRYLTNEAGKLTLAISRTGQKRPVARLTRRVKAGQGQVALGRRLQPGRYQVSAVLTGASGARSRPARLAFRVLPG